MIKRGITMNKKSQGLSITTIIVAAIALIVLVVLVAIFTGRIGLFSKGIGEATTCESLGGKCLATVCGEVTSPLTQRIYGVTDCGQKENTNENNPYCCKAP